MKFLKMKKESRTYSRHTDHIFSADFALIKKELEAAGEVYQNGNRFKTDPFAERDRIK